MAEHGDHNSRCRGSLIGCVNDKLESETIQKANARSRSPKESAREPVAGARIEAMAAPPFAVGERVRSDGCVATVRYVGSVASAKDQKATYIGVVWDDPTRGMAHHLPPFRSPPHHHPHLTVTPPPPRQARRVRHRLRRCPRAPLLVRRGRRLLPQAEEDPTRRDVRRGAAPAVRRHNFHTLSLPLVTRASSHTPSLPPVARASATSR